MHISTLQAKYSM